MLRRVWYVLLTYVTRRLNWLVGLLLAMYTVPWVAMLFLITSQRDDRLDASVGVLILTLNVALFSIFHSLIRLQFSHAGARLIPNYAIPHLIPIGFVWLFYVVLSTASLKVEGVEVFAALGLSLLPWGLCCGCGLVIPAALSPGSRRRLWVMIPFFGLIMISPLLEKLWFLFGAGSPVEGYLQGHEPVWTLAFIFGGLAATAGYVRQSLRLSVQYCELGYSSPLILVSDAPSTWRKEIAQHQTVLSMRA